MNNLEQATAIAQRWADRERKPMVILNLNPFGRLYVVRDYDDKLLDSKNFIALIEPRPACSKGTTGCTITNGPHLNCWIG